MPDPYNFMAGYESGSALDALPSSTRGLPNFGHLTSGSNASLAGLGGADWSKFAPALGLLPALFAGQGSSLSGPIREIQTQARQQGEQGGKIAAQGQDALAQAMKHFMDLSSGDPTAVQAATAPERRKVLDQYDTARRSTAQFTPRGGGQASTQQESRAREAGDLATLGASARENAASSLASLGMSEQQAGLSAQEQSTQMLAQALGPLFQQQQADQQSLVGTFTGLAQMIAPLLIG